MSKMANRFKLSVFRLLASLLLGILLVFFCSAFSCVLSCSSSSWVLLLLGFFFVFFLVHLLLRPLFFLFLPFVFFLVFHFCFASFFFLISGHPIVPHQSSKGGRSSVLSLNFCSSRGGRTRKLRSICTMSMARMPTHARQCFGGSIAFAAETASLNPTNPPADRLATRPTDKLRKSFETTRAPHCE